MRMINLLVYFFVSFCYLSAQQFVSVDVFPDKKYFAYPNSKSVYQMDLDGFMKEYSKLIPESVKTTDVPRPKIRMDRVWYSDGAKIYNRPLDAKGNAKWESLALPKGIMHFSDFDIISENEAVICGAHFDNSDGKKEILDIHFVFDYSTGKIIKTLESFDHAFVENVKNLAKTRTRMPTKMFFDSLLKTQSYICMFAPYLLIVPKTGNVIIYDIGTRKERKIEIIPSKELPSDPEKVINGGESIPWVGPLGGEKVLLSCRMDAPKSDKPNEHTTIYVFRTLDLRTGQVKLHGTEYMGQKDALDPYFEHSGKLISTKEFLKNKGFFQPLPW